MQSPEADTVQKYGRPNEATPAKWNAEYKDFNAPLENGTTITPSKVEPASTVAGATEEVTETVTIEKPTEESPASPIKEEEKSKKRKRHEGETAEERSERKRKKKEKKEKRKSKSKKDESEDSE